MSRKKMAQRVAMRVARNLTQEFFQDPLEGEERVSGVSYGPWKTSLSYLDRHSLTPEFGTMERDPKLLAEVEKDDNWS